MRSSLEGWAWTGYLKEGRVLHSGEGRTEVRIDYRSPHGDASGAYEATLEGVGTVMTMESSGDAGLVEVDRYSVARLEKTLQRVWRGEDPGPTRFL